MMPVSSFTSSVLEVHEQLGPGSAIDRRVYRCSHCRIHLTVNCRARKRQRRHHHCGAKVHVSVHMNVSNHTEFFISYVAVCPSRLDIKSIRAYSNNHRRSVRYIDIRLRHTAVFQRNVGNSVSSDRSDRRPNPVSPLSVNKS